MALEQPGFLIGVEAGENMTAMQHTLVMISADMTVIQTNAATDIPCGILQNTPNVGEAASVMVAGISKLISGAGGLTAGSLVGPAADGKGIIADPDGAAEAYYFGQVLIACAENEKASVLINCAVPVLTAGS